MNIYDKVKGYFRGTWMIKNRDSLKARASNLSKKTNIPNKYLIQNFYV